MAVGSVGGSRGSGATYYKQIQAKQQQRMEARRDAERRAAFEAQRQSMQAMVGNVYAANYNLFDQSAQLTVVAVNERSTAEAEARIKELQASIDDTIGSLATI